MFTVIYFTHRKKVNPVLTQIKENNCLIFCKCVYVYLQSMQKPMRKNLRK